MTKHNDIMLALGEAIRTNADIAAFCAEHFGRALDIHIGAYANGIPDEKDSPFCWICANEDENESVAADATFTVRVVVAGCVKGADGESYIETRTHERTATENGLVADGGGSVIEDLRDSVCRICATALVGAIPSAIRREEQPISHLPLDWAVIYVDYLEPTDISEYIN